MSSTATPKRRGSSRRRNNRRSQPRHKATMPQLVMQDNKRVPAHTVTEENPIYKGIKYFVGKKRKK